MADQAYRKYSNRVVAQKSGGRYDLSEVWIVPNIDKTGGGNDDPSDTWQHEALAAPDLPVPGDQTADGKYVCVSRTPRSLDNQGFAYVDVRWQEDPLTLATEVNFFTASKIKPAWRGIATDPGTVADQNGNELWDADETQDIRNSAGDRYNPGVTYEGPLERIEVTFRTSLLWHDTGAEAGLEPSGAFHGNWNAYLKHWNVSPWTVTQTDPDKPENSSSRTFPAGSLMFLDKRAPLVKDPYFHRLVTCAFLHDPDLWGMRLPDMGPRCRAYLKLSGGTLSQKWYDETNHAGVGTVTDCMGRPFSGPAELDGEGRQLMPDPTTGKMPPAKIFQWWPVDDDGNLLCAEFDDLMIFTPERDLDV